MIRSQLSRSTFGLALVSALSFSSCGKVNDMHDATMEMKDNMNKTVGTMDGMSKTTERMEETTCKMYTSLRQGNAKASRDADMEVINKDGESINAKLESAATYMQGFEYQVWTPSCEEVAPREIVIDQAATEILTRSEPFMKDRSKVTATQMSDHAETIYALAGTLHRVNLLQKGYLKGSSEKMMSPLDILVQGLRYDQQKNRGELAVTDMPSWATAVAKYGKNAEYLLRVRANFLMGYAYAIADSDDFGNTPGFAEKIVRLVKTKLGKKWTPNLESRGPTEIRERMTVSLRLAKETQDAMLSLGIDPMMDQTMLKLWSAADFSKLGLEKMAKGKGDDPARAKAIRELMQARDRLLSRGAGGSW